MTSRRSTTPAPAGWPTCPRSVLIEGYLLIHADTMAYLEFGKTLDEINTTFHRPDAQARSGDFGYQTRQLFRRFDFLDRDQGVNNARFLLAVLGGKQIVHGHSTIPETFGVSPSLVDGPMLYADGLVMAADTGLALGARCVAIELETKAPA